MGLYPNRLSFRYAKRQWGSCSEKNNISLNIMLAKLPKDLVRYIIIHELSHIKYKNHQKEFWNFVAKYEPRYKQLTQELKKYQTI
jgi:predicted metal-dependent hydrolase